MSDSLPARRPVRTAVIGAAVLSMLGGIGVLSVAHPDRGTLLILSCAYASALSFFATGLTLLEHRLLRILHVLLMPLVFLTLLLAAVLSYLISRSPTGTSFPSALHWIVAAMGLIMFASVLLSFMGWTQHLLKILGRRRSATINTPP